MEIVRSCSVKLGVKVIVIIATYTLLFAELPGAGNAVQLLALGMLVVAAGLAAYEKAPISANRGVNVFFVVMSIMCVTSYLGSILLIANDGIKDHLYSVIYTTILVVTAISLNNIGRILLLSDVLDIIYISFGLMTLSVVALERWEMITSLHPAHILQTSKRFEPFDLHPNLVGIMFSTGAIAAQYKLLSGKTLSKVVAFVCLLCALIIIMAASARASMLAYLFSTAVMVVVGFSKFPKHVRSLIVGTVSLIGLAVAFNASLILKYLRILLALDSAGRGLGSGGSGRFELWQHGLDYAFSDITRVVFGGGVRTSIDFSTENSYITIMIDSGLIVSLLFFATVVYFLIASFRKYISTADGPVGFIANIMLFMLVESFFNRYLLAIGNPTSIVFLLLLCVVGYRSRFLSMWSEGAVPSRRFCGISPQIAPPTL